METPAPDCNDGWHERQTESLWSAEAQLCHLLKSADGRNRSPIGWRSW